jgi:glycosyltransferase involved in cell wall biosynthesis
MPAAPLGGLVTTPAVSIIVPVFNEAASLAELHRQVSDVLDPAGVCFEMIFVNDGSSDQTARVLGEMSAVDGGHVRAIHFEQNRGKALALSAGFSAALGETIITMDGDLQDDPREIPRFLATVRAGHDLVSGWKFHRRDSFIKNSTSVLYNRVTSLVSGVALHDHNCGFKAYRHEVAVTLPLSGQLHRYIPMLAHARGFTSITEITVNHRVRVHGASKYGLSRFLHGLIGLGHAVWIVSRIKRAASRRPRHSDSAPGLPDSADEALRPTSR